MNKINLGIIGYGHWGPNYVRIFSSLKGVQVKSVCDLDKNRLKLAKERFPGINTMTNHSELFLNNDIDAIVIVTPTSTHYKLTKACLKNNKHVLVEKPLCTKVEEAEELVLIARKKKKVLMVGHIYEYNACIKKIREYIINGELGNIYYIYSNRLNLGPLRDDVNAIWDLAPHEISIFNFILKHPPIKVSACSGNFLRKKITDVGFITLFYPSNIVAHINVSWLSPRKVRQITIIGDKKMLIFDDLNDIEPIKIYNKGFSKEPYYDSFDQFKLLIREGDIVIPKIKLDEPLKNECMHFLECIITGKRPQSDSKNGLGVVKVLSAIEKSIKKNSVMGGIK